jgi:hypothetical protein
VVVITVVVFVFVVAAAARKISKLGEKVTKRKSTIKIP